MLVEDEMELSEKTKREIEAARKEIKEGKYIPHEELKKRLGL
jgi:predicted transcriptional regulator